MNKLLDDTHAFRRPSQRRGELKFNNILDAAEALITMSPNNELSLYDIAAQAEVAVGSVYHFFPTVESIRLALISRHDEGFALIARELSGTFNNWEEAFCHFIDQSLLYMNSHPIAQYIVIGKGQSWITRHADVEGDQRIAEAISHSLNKRFELPDTPAPQTLLFSAIRIISALWEVSVHLHEEVTEEHHARAKEASLALLKLHWPTELASK